MVWSVIFLQAVGGIFVGIVLKYADNILKTMANSISMVLSCLVEMAFFDFKPSWSFAIGAFLVNASTVIYVRSVGCHNASTLHVCSMPPTHSVPMSTSSKRSRINVDDIGLPPFETAETRGFNLITLSEDQ